MSLYISKSMEAVATLGLDVALASGASIIFGISTPKAIAVHTTGMHIAALALSQFTSESSTLVPKLLNMTAITILSFDAGKKLAKKVCNVDVTVNDYFKVLAGVVAFTFAEVIVTKMAAELI